MKVPSWPRQQSKFRNRRQKRDRAWRRSLTVPLRMEPLEQRQMLSVNPVFLGDLNPGSDPSLPANVSPEFVQAGETVFFVAEDVLHGRELWKTDGTIEGTMLVKDIDPGKTPFSYIKNDLLVYGETANSSSPEHLTNVNGTLFFTASDGTGGRELWKSDGTADGTLLVRDLFPGTFYEGPGQYVPYSSNPENLTNVNGTLYFTAFNDVYGEELWKSGGDHDTTVVVKDIAPGEGDYGSYGMLPKSSAPSYLTNVNGTLYFSAYHEDSGQELWKSDGTAAGTVLIKDIRPGESEYPGYGTYPNSSQPMDLVDVNGTLFFSADNGTDGLELWKSDGTTAGTVMVKDIYEGSSLDADDEEVPNTGDPTQLTNVDGTLFFSADNGTDGVELWKSDGTTAGTVMVKDIRPGETDYGNYGTHPSSSSPLELVDVGGTLFFIAHNGTDGMELWKSDGTAAGTVMVKDIRPGETDDPVYGALPNSSTPQSLTDVNGTLYFSAYDDTNGRELWESDGTAAGTLLVQDLSPGTTYHQDFGDFPDSGFPQYLTNIDGTLYFSADDGVNGREAWNLPPTAIDLLAATDSGLSDQDNLTNFNNSSQSRALQFVVGGVANGAMVRVFADGVEIGSAVASGDSATVTTNGTVLLAEGRRTITATEELGGVVSDVPSTLAVNVDTVAPAAFDTTAPATAYAGHDYFYDAHSPDENTAGMTVSLVGAPSGMTFDQNAEINWTPEASDVGTVSFEIRITDDAGNHTSESVTLDVLGSITTLPDSYSPTEDEMLVVVAGEGVLDNDGDDSPAGLTVTLVDPPAHGVLHLDPEGSFTYDPNDDYHGPDSFTYTATDGTRVSGVTTVTFDVQPVNDVPVAASDVYATNVGTTLVVDSTDGVLGNDDDVDGDTLTATLVDDVSQGDLQLNSDGSFSYAPVAGFVGTITFTYKAGDDTTESEIATATIEVNNRPVAADDPYEVDEDNPLTVPAGDGVLYNDSDDEGDPMTAVLVSGPDHGTLSLDDNGAFTYTPDDNYYGTDSFTYVARDAYQDSEPATVAIVVNSVNDAPLGVDDSYTTDVGVTLHVAAATGVLDNDPDVDDELLTASLGQDVSHGDLTLNPDGSFDYVPDAGYVGEDTFTYTAYDGEASSETVTVTLTVNGPPTADDDVYELLEDEVLSPDKTEGVLKNDTDPNGDELTATLVSYPQHGTISFDTDGSFSYTPNSHFNGTDTFTYTTSDGRSVSDPATVTLQFEAVDDPPVAVDDAYAMDEGDGLQTLDVLENDDDPDGETLTIVAFTQGSGGGVVAIADGGDKIEYTPAAGFDGVETFTYTIEDADGLTDQATVTMTVGDDADNPITGAAISGYVYNDVDNDGERDDGEIGIPGAMITLTGFTDDNTQVKTSVLTSIDGYYLFDGLLPGTYEVTETQPEALRDGKDKIGTSGGIESNDQFTEIVLSTDEHSQENNFGERGLRATSISIDMFLASTPPIEDYIASTIAGAERSAGNEELATLILAGATDVPDSLIDGAPVGVNDSYAVVEFGTLTLAAADGVLDNDVDLEGDVLSATLVSQPENGTLTFNSDGSFTYTPDTSFEGTDTFTYRANDGLLESNETEVTIIVIPGDDSPSFANLTDVTLLGGSPLFIPLDGFDPDGQVLTYTATSSDESLVSTTIPEGNRSMRVSVDGYGDMVLELYEHLVPEVTDKIIGHAEAGNYDGTLFHRVWDGFMIQGGTFISTTEVAPSLDDYDDQFHVDLQHNQKGVLSLANGDNDDTNSNGFFITEEPTRHLDFNHSVFGQLIEGEATREAISNVLPVSSSKWPDTDVVIDSVEIFVDEENAVLMLKAPEGASGAVDVTVTVTDEDDQTYEQIFHVVVEPDPYDGGPFLEPIPDMNTAVDTPITFQLSAIDVEGDDFVFDAKWKGPANYTFTVDNESGEVTVTPAAGFLGEIDIEVQVWPAVASDTQHPYDSQIVKINVLSLADLADAALTDEDNWTS